MPWLHTISIIMRLLTLLAFAACCPHTAAVGSDGNFSGAWVAWLCPAGVRYDPAICSNFVLELYQARDKLCGAHVFATAGAVQMDEGAAPSLLGTIAGSTATVVVESGRASPPIRVRSELTMVKDGLQWRRLESPDGDYLLPVSARLSRSRHETLLHPVFAQKLRAACAAANAAPEAGAAETIRPSTQTREPQ
jgi:hypothetical protein